MNEKEKKHLIDTLDAMAEALVDGGHKFSPKQRKAYEDSVEIMQAVKPKNKGLTALAG